MNYEEKIKMEANQHGMDEGLTESWIERFYIMLEANNYQADNEEEMAFADSKKCTLNKMHKQANFFDDSS